MPVPPFAQVQVSINGGAPTSGGLTAAPSQTIAPSGVNTTGWQAALWEIYDYAPGVASVLAGAGYTLSSLGVYYYQPVNPTSAPPSWTMPASGANNWGPLAIRLRINNNPLQRNANGSPNIQFNPAYTDEATMIKVASPHAAMLGVAFNESNQYDTIRQSIGSLMTCLRLLDTLIAQSGIATTGSGVWHNTAGSLDAAAYHGTAGQALFTASSGTDTAWATITGDLSFSVSTVGQAKVTGIQGIAVSNTAPTNGQVLEYNGTQYVPTTITVPPGVTWANDLVGSTATNQWVAAISGNAGGGGTVALNITTLQFAQGQASPALSQATQANGSAPNNLTVSPQQAGSGATSNANATPGSLIVNVGPATNNSQAGTEGGVGVQRSGATTAFLGTITGATTQGGLWLGTGGSASANHTNATTSALYGDGSTVTNLNAPSGGTASIQIAGATSMLAATISGIQMFSSTFNLGGGSKVLGLANATTVPSSNPGGGVVMWSSGGWWGIRGSNGIIFSSQIVTKTANYTIDSGTTPDGIILADTNSIGAFSITLPTPATSQGRQGLYVIDLKGTFGANNLTIVQHATELINGVNSSLVISASGACLQIMTDGTNWIIR